MVDKYGSFESFRSFVTRSTQQTQLEQEVIRSRFRHLDIPSDVGIHFLVDMITLLLNLYDPYTARHSHRVAFLAEKISREYSRTEGEHQRTHIAAHLHDIGKIGISSQILNKATPLTAEEFELIKHHSLYGYSVISRLESLTPIAKIVLYHHERFDGKGYPHGLSGTAIPFDSRIIAVADSFDAMTTDRPYHKGLTSEEAVCEVLSCAGKQFDPEVVEKFEILYSRTCLELPDVFE